MITEFYYQLIRSAEQYVKNSLLGTAAVASTEQVSFEAPRNTCTEFCF